MSGISLSASRCANNWSLLSSKKLAVALRERLDHIEHCCRSSETNEKMQDVTDRKAYRAMRQKLKKYDLSLTVNSDGSRLFKSSKYSIWPVQVTVNELPPHIRSKHVFTTQLWYGQSHPEMGLLMGSFVQEMEDLMQGGITWTDGTTFISSQVCTSFKTSSTYSTVVALYQCQILHVKYHIQIL